MATNHPQSRNQVPASTAGPIPDFPFLFNRASRPPHKPAPFVLGTAEKAAQDLPASDDTWPAPGWPFFNNQPWRKPFFHEENCGTNCFCGNEKVEPKTEPKKVEPAEDKR
jgi:hypothetical protein